ncbi:hypothetical protein [Seonamhaeicola aphaedonensis]|uniref:Uncharacterized protein n=1 Tax=Seonamhaeicola aphaedonensis TaxID=1461338 RepID=A0A3D9HF69_9FLAO|nr:hypothetical protein [Seonamhaeicola aphaedonensis]RED47891.1 hypothetical protein DFQ02_105118 [Seonamhaeicola aphaedonensis]
MGLQKYFNLNRFYKYFKYDLTLNGKTYALALLGLFVVLFIVDVFTLSTASSRVNFNRNYYTPIFIFFLVLTGVVSAGTSFSALRSSKTSIHYLLIPVSNFEKFIVQFLIRIMGFVLLFLPLYWLTFKLAYGFYSLFAIVSENVESYNMLSPFQWQENKVDIYILVSLASGLILFAFCGAASFKKYALFKSILTFALFVLAWFLLMVILSHIFYDHDSKELLEINLRSYRVQDGVYNTQIYATILFAGLSLILLPLAYFKLKERET